MTLGERIRRVRNQQEMTLERLAERTGLTISFLSQVERDVVSPSVESLQKLAQAFGINVGVFFGNGEEVKEITLIRRGERSRLVDESSHSTVEQLAGGLLQVRLDPKIFTIDAQGTIDTKHMPSTQEAFGYVLQGEVKIVRDKDKSLFLSKGDSVYMKNPSSYHLSNEGTQKAEVFWITFAAVY